MKGKIITLAFLILIPAQILAPHKTPAVWVEINDASPAYGIDELSKVVGILEKHRIERIVIFVIPNHGGSMPLGDYPEFSDFLKELEKKGYEIGVHGYSHRGFEFYCSESEALQRLNFSVDEFHAAGIYPEVFFPPRYFVKGESFTVLEDNFKEVYLINKVVKEGQELPYIIHEFTWFRMPKWLVMPVAKASYTASRSDVYRLSLHISRMDEGRLEFLDSFLEFTDIQNA